jgi:hypothetical protein
MLASELLRASTLISETEHYELRLVAPDYRELEAGVSGLFINYILVRKDNACIELWGGMLGFMENQLELIQASHTHSLGKKREALQGNVVSIGVKRLIVQEEPTDETPTTH